MIAEKSAPKSAAPVVGCKVVALLDGCSILPAVLVGCKMVALDVGTSELVDDGCSNEGLELDIVRDSEVVGNTLGVLVLVEDVGMRRLPEECDV